MTSVIISKSTYYRPEEDTSKWIVSVQGNYSYDCEISLVRKDFKHGQKSWGWGGISKIIMFTGTGKISKKRFQWMKNIAKLACISLNKESE
jgi:hypothetical protein